MKRELERFLREEDAMGVVEVVLIIMVLVGLALIFKNQITQIANSIFTKLKKQVNTF